MRKKIIDKNLKKSFLTVQKKYQYGNLRVQILGRISGRFWASANDLLNGQIHAYESFWGT